MQLSYFIEHSAQHQDPTFAEAMRLRAMLPLASTTNTTSAPAFLARRLLQVADSSHHMHAASTGWKVRSQTSQLYPARSNVSAYDLATNHCSLAGAGSTECDSNRPNFHAELKLTRPDDDAKHLAAGNWPVCLL